MKLLLGALVAASAACALPATAQPPQFRVLAFYSTHVEPDHVTFAEQAIPFFTAIAKRDHFFFTATTHGEDMNLRTLKQYDVVLWLDDVPSDPNQRTAFAQYMQEGGGWLGFHIAGYNDDATHWPWFVSFLGGAVFFSNNWPPLPATLQVENRSTSVTHGIPNEFLSPANEWYMWSPDPRTNRAVKVLLSLEPANYPLGWKDTLVSGDLPVVWTNTNYRMLYVNMGHGDKIFTSATQNLLFENALLWLGTRKHTERAAPVP